MRQERFVVFVLNCRVVFNLVFKWFHSLLIHFFASFAAFTISLAGEESVWTSNEKGVV